MTNHHHHSHSEAHDHAGHDHPHHGHSHVHVHGKSLTWALLLTLLFAFIEVAGGLWSGSLALLSDAGHMFSDVAALGLAAFAQWIAQKPPSTRHSYGLARAEVVAALLNGVFMLLVIVWIVVEAVQRLLVPHVVSGGVVMLVALAGLAVNVFVALVLSRGEQSLNSRAALLHVMGDLLGSVAALIAGAVIHYTGWTPIDPLLSVLVAGLILLSTVNLLRHALHSLLDGVPQGLDLAAIGHKLAHIQGVLSVHDLHIWSLGGDRTALSAHMQLASLDQWTQILATSRAMLHRDYGISHVTLQPETDGEFNRRFELKVPIHISSPVAHD